MLARVCERFHVVDMPLSLMGVHIGSRMTLVELASGGLFAHSPVRLDESTRRTIDRLGDVRYIVAPSLFHHLFLVPFSRHYPDAQVWGPPGIEKKQPEARITGRLTSGGNLPWSDEFDTFRVGGMPEVQEHLFYHRATRSLIVTDLIFNIANPFNGWTALFMRLNGVANPPGISRIFRRAIRDKAAFRDSLRPVLALDIERIFLPHGDLILANGAELLRQALAPALVDD